MPVWLQVAGAIAGAILSYYGRYDDTNLKEMIKDIAYDLKQALQLLNEISVQIADLSAKLDRLPDEFRKIYYRAELQDLNDTILAAVLRYRQLIRAHQNDTRFSVEQAKLIYDDVVKARTKLQVKWREYDVRFAPLAALVSPISFVLELGLLFRLGREARGLRRSTEQSYLEWFNALLDPSIPNSVAANAKQNGAELTVSDGRVKSGLLWPALSQPDIAQAVYCLEHQIGSTIPFLFDPRRTIAQVYQLTWIRFCGVVRAHVITMNGENIWDTDVIGQSFAIEQYSRNAGTGGWYGGAPRWNIPIDAYDSRDTQRFEGQSHPQRVADILNSPKWRNFLITSFPAAIQEVAHNNQTRLELRMANDVIATIGATHHVVQHINDGRIQVEADSAE